MEDWQADRGDQRQRLDLALLRHCAGRPGLTRRQVQRWIEDGRVRVNGAVAARAARRLALGDEIATVLPPLAAGRGAAGGPALLAQDLPLAILYEDEHVLAVDKPAGMVVHPAGRYRDGTLANALLFHLGENPGLVSRLDRDTTGVLLVAKTAAAHAALARARRAGTLEKDYLAVVYGRPPHAKGRIDLALCRDGADPRRVAAVRAAGPAPAGALPAVTLYEILKESAALALLRCRLVTGRTHQIRVHLGAIGLPLVGDPLYGEPRHRGLAAPGLAAACRDFPRQALHAWRVSLRHPDGGAPLVISAPLPADLRALLAAADLGTLE